MTDHNIARTEFETKDSGERVEFDSGMTRDTTVGKVLWHLVTSGPMLRRWAGLLTRGAVKYSADNWLKAAGTEEYDRFRESAFRHFMQWYSGENDEDHAAAVYFNINGAEYVREKMAATLPPTITLSSPTSRPWTHWTNASPRPGDGLRVWNDMGGGEWFYP